MAVISTSKLILYDKWPGTPNPNLGKPADGWDGTTHHDVSVAAYPIGTKISQYNDSTINPGWYTMIYLQFAEGSDYAYDGNGDITDQGNGSGFCFPYETTGNMVDGTDLWYLVSNDLTNTCQTLAIGAGAGKDFNARVAVCAGDISGNAASTSRNNFGWFWCGGPCPIVDCTNLYGDISTDGAVVAELELVPVDDGANGATVGPADWSLATDGTGGPPNWSGAIIGYSLITDA